MRGVVGGRGGFRCYRFFLFLVVGFLRIKWLGSEKYGDFIFMLIVRRVEYDSKFSEFLWEGLIYCEGSLGSRYR